MRLTVLSLALCFASLYTVTGATVQNGRLCGRRLLNFMEFICDEGFYDPFTVAKRSVDGLRLFPGYGSQQKSGFLGAESASQLLQKRIHGPTTGIYQECCLKPCTIDEAQTYCSK
ncbi:bombyxin A-3 homolog [Ornithodoros turicata]|uniref:bombyxin A-3 homolog n=1 Tax=Ornithodoros turicata TaxID=34597 RepID=UPI003139A4E4